MEVLVIDDEDAVRDLLADIVGSLGHQVTARANGVQALENYVPGRFQLVLTDIGMPGLTGWQVAGMVRAADPDVMLAFVTGWAEDVTPEAEAALLGAFIPMIAAGTFLFALDIRPDRSPLRAQFDLMWDTPTPNRLQRWYIPIIGAALAGVSAELLRTVITFAGRARLSLDVIAAAAALGALEGLFVALALALGVGIGAVILTPRHSRAA